jgi:2,3-diketo-5-methylthio-1-phosphopentane phosphatase
VVPRLDLARTHVFLDFDGTISTQDTGMYLLERLARPEWRDLHDRYEAGDLGSRECIGGQWALVEAAEEEARAVAREVAVDPGFEALVGALRASGALITVISDGFGFYVHDVCEPLGLDVVTNVVDFANGVLTFPHRTDGCACSTCGVCKPAPIRAARERGLTTVLVGDGASDRHAAAAADVVFAKDGLAAWCEAQRISFRPFRSLAGVHAALLAPERGSGGA